MAFRRFLDSFISLLGLVVSTLSWYNVKQYSWFGLALGIIAIAFAVFLVYSFVRNLAKPQKLEGEDIVGLFTKIWDLADVGRDLCNELLRPGRIKVIADRYTGEIIAFFDAKSAEAHSQLPNAIDKNLFRLAKSAHESKRKKKAFVAACAKVLDHTLDFKGTEEFIKIRRELAFEDIERHLSHELKRTDKSTYIAHLSAEINQKIAELKKRRKYWKLTYLFFPDLKRLMNTRFDEERFFNDPRLFELLLLNSLKIEKVDVTELLSGSLMVGIFMTTLPDLLGGAITDALWDELGFNLGAEFFATIGIACVDITGILLLYRLSRLGWHLWRWITGQAFKDFRAKFLVEVYKFVNETKGDVISSQQKSCEMLVVRLNDTFAEAQLNASKKAKKYAKFT